MRQSNVILHFDNDWGLSVVNDPDTKSVEVWPISFHTDGMASRVGNGPYLVSVTHMIDLCEELDKLSDPRIIGNYIIGDELMDEIVWQVTNDNPH